MTTLINYTEKGEKSVIEFDNLEDAYNFTFNNDCTSIEVVGEGVYTIGEFQTAFSNDQFVNS